MDFHLTEEQKSIQKEPWSPLSPLMVGNPGFRIECGMTDYVKLLLSCINLMEVRNE